MIRRTCTWIVTIIVFVITTAAFVNSLVTEQDENSLFAATSKDDQEQPLGTIEDEPSVKRTVSMSQLSVGTPENSSYQSETFSFISISNKSISTKQRSLWERQYCLQSDTYFYETVTTSSRLISLFYQRRGIPAGSCGTLCATLCGHQPCALDYYVGTEGLTCSCIINQLSQCVANSQCVSTTKGEVCTCSQGYAGNGTISCSNIDECALGYCGSQGNCTDLVPGYDCSCLSGFQYTGVYGTGCVDINECATGSPCGPNTICTNTPGSFSCACESGYNGTPPTTFCLDIDECAALPNRCGTFGQCINLPGSFYCNCSTGFYWPNKNSQCLDINECANTKLCKPTTEVCRNTPGGYVCDCAPGYSGASPNCINTNECSAATNPCGPNSICTDTIGGFTCKCEPGYPGGNPPTEPCRKLIKGESCPNPNLDPSSYCDTGLLCAIKSSSNTNIFACCPSTVRCNVNLQCCAFAYGRGETCPSGSNFDCQTGLKCTRQSFFSSRKICCTFPFTLFGITFCLFV